MACLEIKKPRRRESAGAADEYAEVLLRRIDRHVGVDTQQVVQTARIVSVAVRDDDEIERREIDILGAHIVRKDVGVVAGIKEDALSAVLNECRKPQSFFIAEDLPNAS